MPKPAGWTLRAVGAVASGVASLTVAVPAGTVDNDTLVLSLVHQGADWAVVPAGWTLLGRKLEGVVRTEGYVRRAATEPASYNVTGLATIARGAITTYTGGALADPIVVASSIGGGLAGTRTGAPSITPPLDRCLLIAILGSGANEPSANPETQQTDSVSRTVADLSTRRFVTRIASGAAGVFLGQYDVVKTIGTLPTGDLQQRTASSVMAGDHGAIFAALAPEEAATTAGTRYYLAEAYPATWLKGEAQGAWESAFLSPRGYGPLGYVWELRQRKVDAGKLHFDTADRNSPNADILFYRWVTPPLDAQALGGTLQLNMLTSVFKGSGFGDEPAPSAAFKVHAYVTQGDSLAVRATLLNQYVDPTTWTGSTGTVRQLTAPQALAAVNTVAGDRIAVEIGIRLTTPDTWPVPTRPPSRYISLRCQRGATDPNNPEPNVTANVGGLEQAAGSTNALAVPYLDFSQTIVEQTVTLPAIGNVDATTAAALTGESATAAIDTRGVVAPMRQVWYQWTAPRDESVIVHAWGSYYGVTIDVFQDAAGTSQVPYLSRTINQVVGALAGAVFAATAGTTYRVRAYVSSAPNAGGPLRLTLTPVLPLRADDVILGCNGILARWNKAGILAHVSFDFASLAISGLAIDYTKRPMANLNGGTHSGLRLYVGIFGLDYVEIVDLETFNVGELEVDYMTQVIAADNRNLGSLAISPTGTLVITWWGDGFTRIADSGASYLDALAAGASANLTVVDASHADHQAGAPYAAVPTVAAALEAGGVNYGEFGPVDVTLFYTSGGWYIPIGGHRIKRINPTTGEQLADFAVLPNGPGNNPGLKGLFPFPSTPALPGGGVLVCNGGEVTHLSQDGRILRHLLPTPVADRVSLADVELQADGAALWVLDEATSTLFRIDMTTGETVVTIETGLGVGTSTSLVLFRCPAQV